MLEQMRRRTEDIIRYYGELSRRVSTKGVDGIPQLLELVKQLLDQLVRMDARLEHLRELKTLLTQPQEIEQGRRRSSL